MEPSNKAIKQARERGEEEARQRLEEAEKNNAKQAWMADGGDEEDFEKAWPDMRRQIRAERTKQAADEARQASEERTRANF